jgi:hypothetical protein
LGSLFVLQVFNDFLYIKAALFFHINMERVMKKRAIAVTAISILWGWMSYAHAAMQSQSASQQDAFSGLPFMEEDIHEENAPLGSDSAGTFQYEKLVTASSLYKDVLYQGSSNSFRKIFIPASIHEKWQDGFTFFEQEKGAAASNSFDTSLKTAGLSGNGNLTLSCSGGERFRCVWVPSRAALSSDEESILLGLGATVLSRVGMSVAGPTSMESWAMFMSSIGIMGVQVARARKKEFETLG